VVIEYETIDDLFRPTPLPILDALGDDDDVEGAEAVLKPTASSKALVFSEWVLAHSVRWIDVELGQMMKLKQLKSNRFSTVRVEAMDPHLLTVAIKHEDCWLFCRETLEMVTSDRMVYLIEPTDSDSASDSGRRPHSDSNRRDSEAERGRLDVDRLDRLYEAIDRINENHSGFKQWVEGQVAAIQHHGHRDVGDVDEFKVSDAMHGVLTDYLDDKMSKLVAMLELQQNAIQSITENVHRMQHSEHAPGNGSAAQWDWDAVEERMDRRIESVVRDQMESRFDHLAQHIAEQIAKEMEDPPPRHRDHRHNDQVMRGGEGHRAHGEEAEGRTESAPSDWAYRVVSHSKLKRNSHDVLSECGYWIVDHLLFPRWNQQSVSASYRAGDCTPLRLEPSSSGNSAPPYITIELYQPVAVRRVSLYHFHSPVLTQRAINAAPRDFQIWGSHNLTKWYPLGNFTYDFYGDRDTQYFDVADPAPKKAEGEDEQNGDGVINETTTTSADVARRSTYEDFQNGFRFVAFRLLSNTGGSDYGCIYRLRVYGDAI